MGTFNKRETSGNHHCVSLILFSPIPAPTGGKWKQVRNELELLQGSKTLGIPPLDSNSFRLLASTAPEKHLPDSSWILIRISNEKISFKDTYTFHFENLMKRSFSPRPSSKKWQSGRGEIGLRSITKLERSARENDDCILLARRSDARKDLSTAKFFHPASAMAAQGPSLLPFHAVINRFQALSLLVQRRGSRDKK